MTTAVIFVAGPIPDLDRPGRRVAAGPTAAPAGPDGRAQGPPTTAMEPTTLGDRLRRRIRARNPLLTIAADGGLDLALALGDTPDLVIGDMDSVTDRAIGVAKDAGSTISVVPRAKDESDFELALDEAVRHGASHLLVVGGAAGRLDHVLATVLTLTSTKYADVVLEALLVDNYVAVLHGDGTAATTGSDDPGDPPDTFERGPSTAVAEGLPGDPVSLFAIGGSAVGVRTAGLVWPLSGDTLPVGSSRGVSNELVGGRATVALERGCVAVVRTARYEPVIGDVDAVGDHARIDGQVVAR